MGKKCFDGRKRSPARGSCRMEVFYRNIAHATHIQSVPNRPCLKALCPKPQSFVLGLKPWVTIWAVPSGTFYNTKPLTHSAIPTPPPIQVPKSPFPSSLSQLKQPAIRALQSPEENGFLICNNGLQKATSGNVNPATIWCFWFLLL